MLLNDFRSSLILELAEEILVSASRLSGSDAGDKRKNEPSQELVDNCDEMIKQAAAYVQQQTFRRRNCRLGGVRPRQRLTRS